eukprot:TRINITY_DN51347_c0_g1_i1.p1 TRINITY_DN51347_c0_g1~~TRINITY_DN51347_c0_g1_i1.p1  ORF type:complete len:629 (+),score=289.44 TRINITY_DN51347_c0_g1_i1:42-1889(+)
MAGGNQTKDAPSQEAGFLPRFITWLKHAVMKLLLRVLVFIFYREVDVIGLDKIPLDGPVIFCGNHQNQFVDALMLYTCTPRNVGFIIAAKSLKRAIVGGFAKLLDAIPVRRPQDEAKVGTGNIHTISVKGGSGTVTGTGTSFTKQVLVNDLLNVKDPVAGEMCVKVVEVVSDTELSVKAKEDYSFTGSGAESFKILPKIDHDVMFQQVYNTLGGGGCIGIFPEGGSHDRTALLPMKDGIARFALGAKERDIDVKIIPVGLTYYYGHRFRSRAHVEFGTPITVSEALVKLHAEDAAKATVGVMETVEHGMRGVTINAPDWQTLKYIHHMRRLYQPSSLKLPVSEILSLTRKFASCFEEVAHKKDPLLEDLLERLDLYQKYLKDYLLTDAQVETLDSLETRTSYWLLLQRMASTARWFLLAIPGAPIALPVGVVARIYSSVKAEQDLKASSVKLRGNDVKASHKMVSALLVAPLLTLFYGCLVAWWFGVWFGLITMAVAPFAGYACVVCALNTMTEARGTFPLLLSLHSKKYMHCYRELFAFRQALARHVMLIVEKHFRDLECWDEEADNTHRRIVSGTRSPGTVGTPKPFEVKHTSRLRAPAGGVLRRNWSQDSLQ